MLTAFMWQPEWHDRRRGGRVCPQDSRAQRLSCRRVCAGPRNTSAWSTERALYLSSLFVAGNRVPRVAMGVPLSYGPTRHAGSYNERWYALIDNTARRNH